MAGKGQSPKRKTAAKGSERAGKKAQAAAPESVTASGQTPTESDADAPEAADVAPDVSEVVAPALAPDEPPRPELHPLARMRDAAPAPDAGGQGSPGAIEHVTTLATTSYAYGHDTAFEWVDAARHAIREQPIKSLLIATGVGFLYGLARR